MKVPIAKRPLDFYPQEAPCLVGETPRDHLGNYKVINRPLNSVKGRGEQVPGFLKHL